MVQDDKDYGFITPDEGGEDLFVHHTSIADEAFKSLEEGVKVSYEASQDHAAEGEYQASGRLRQAADKLDSPTAVQLRLFQTMAEIATEQNSTIVLPVPLDLFGPFVENSTAKHNGNVIPSLLDKLVGSSDQQDSEKKEEQGASVS